MRHAGRIAWPRVQEGYEENRLSVRALARTYGISDTAIHKRAKAENWPRKPAPDQLRHGSPLPLPPRVMLSGSQKPESTDALRPSPPLELPTLKPAQLVRRGRAIIERLLRELEETTEQVGEIEEAIIGETNSDPDIRRRQAMLRAVSLASRSQIAKNLAQAIRALSQWQTPKPLGKKEQQQRDAEFAAKNSPFGQPQLPPPLRYRNDVD